MAVEGFKRKLTGILSADVIGYSRLMRDDEAATVSDLADNRVLITEIIQQQRRQPNYLLLIGGQWYNE